MSAYAYHGSPTRFLERDITKFPAPFLRPKYARHLEEVLVSNGAGSMYYGFLPFKEHHMQTLRSFLRTGDADKCCKVFTGCGGRGGGRGGGSAGAIAHASR